MITPAQIKKIHTILSRHSDVISKSEYKAYLKDNFNAESSKELSLEQASRLIDWLHSMQNLSTDTWMHRPTVMQNWLIYKVLIPNIEWRSEDGFTNWLKKRMGLTSFNTKEEAARVIEGLKGMLDITTDIIEIEGLPVSPNKKMFINKHTGEIMESVWVFDKITKKLKRYDNERY